jgi:beta-glucosidase
VDLDRETNGDLLLVTTMRIDALSPMGTTLGVSCGSGCSARLPIGKALAALPCGKWLRVGIPLKCFRAAGADMRKLDSPFRWSSNAGERIAIADVALGTVVDKTLDCQQH